MAKRQPSKISVYHRKVESDLVLRLTKHFADTELTVIKKAVRSVFGEISGQLLKGQTVEIRGLGSFYPTRVKKQKPTDPRTGELLPPVDRRGVVFKPSSTLKTSVNNALKR